MLTVTITVPAAHTVTVTITVLGADSYSVTITVSQQHTPSLTQSQHPGGAYSHMVTVFQ